MRKIIFQMLISLDGFFEGPEHEIDWHNVDDEFNEYANDFLNSVDTLLFGRVTYQMMASYWPTPSAKTNDPIVAGKMNHLAKIVFSKTLDKVEWENTKLVKGNFTEEIAKLKQQPGKDLAIFGSSDLAVTLIQNNLIDEFHILVNPIVMGRGKSLFEGIPGRLKLKLLKTKTFRSGNVLLYYQPIRK
jgi:dihydrofolate reductase